MKIQTESPDLFVVTPDRKNFLSLVVNPYKHTTDFNFDTLSQMQFKVNKRIYDLEQEKWIDNPCYDYLSKHMLIYSFDSSDKYRFKGEEDYKTVDGKKESLYSLGTQTGRDKHNSGWNFNANIQNAKLQQETELFDISSKYGYSWQQYCIINDDGAIIEMPHTLPNSTCYAIKEYIPVNTGDILFLGSKIKNSKFDSDGEVYYRYRVHFYDEARADTHFKTDYSDYVSYNPTGRCQLTGFKNWKGYIRIELEAKEGYLEPPAGWLKIYSGERRCQSVSGNNSNVYRKQKEQWWVISDIEEQNDYFNSVKTISAYSYEAVLADKTFSISESTLPLYIPDEIPKLVESNSKFIIDAITNDDGTITTYKGAQRMNRGLINQILDYIPDWSIGYITPSVITRYRSISEVDNENIYAFLMNTVQSLYNCYVLFDTEDKKISLISQDNVCCASDVVLSWSNAIKALNINNKDTSFVTAMRVHTNTDQYGIGLINPTGNNTIYNFNHIKQYVDYVVDENHLKSDGTPYKLSEVIDLFQTELRNYLDEYRGYGRTLVNSTLQKVKLESNLSQCYTDYMSIVDIINIYLQDDHPDTYAQYVLTDIPLTSEEIESRGENYKDYFHSYELFCKLKSASKALVDCRNNLQGYISDIVYNKSLMEQIARKFSLNYNTLKSNYEQDNIYECIFTLKEALVLQAYIYESDWKNEDIVFSETYSADDIISTLIDTYNSAQQELNNIYSKPTYEFQVDTTNIFADKNIEMMIDTLYLGNSVTIALDNDWIFPVLLSVHIDYSDKKNSTLSLSTDYKRKPLQLRFCDLFGSINQTSVETPSFTFGV